MSEGRLENIPWNTVEGNIQNITAVEGGFSPAERGLLTLPSGEEIFVKIGIDDNTKKWAKKEVAVYRFLADQSFPYIPALLATNPDETAFALEALTDDWDWADHWSDERLDKTLQTMDTLAAIQPEGEARTLFEQSSLDENNDGWGPLLASTELQEKLRNKFHSIGKEELVGSFNFDAEAKRSAQYVFQKETLVHNDVRADNCAWNPKNGEVKLVDWNWAQLGDPRGDVAALLVHVQNAGLDISKHKGRLDADTLHWLAGFWFNQAVTPIWPNGPEHLRDFQLWSGITALSLAKI